MTYQTTIEWSNFIWWTDENLTAIDDHYTFKAVTNDTQHTIGVTAVCNFDAGAPP